MQESKLKTLRTERHMSQESVARVLYMTRQNYSKIEKGKVRLTLADASKLAEMFDVPLEEIAEVRS